MNANEPKQVVFTLDTDIRYLLLKGEDGENADQQLLLAKLEEARKKFPVKTLMWPGKYAGTNPNCQHRYVPVKWQWNPTTTEQCWTCGAYE